VYEGLLLKMGEKGLVIGKQKRPTSARKRCPPGVKCILREASPLATAALVCS
jgi:hypothetical protein